MEDVQNFRRDIEEVMLSDHQCLVLLGTSLQFGFPLSTSLHTSQLDGNERKCVTIVIPVEGVRGKGFVTSNDCEFSNFRFFDVIRYVRKWRNHTVV